jgi:hypothetical protein
MSISINSSKRTDRSRWRNRARVAASVVASAVAVGGLGVANAAAATPTVLSYQTPSRLIQSTGNLYWTSNLYNPGSSTPYESFVWRASKTNEPGQEIELFSQLRSKPGSFGDITYAQVAGNWYGYFVANYPKAGISRIERIGLTPTASAYIVKDNLPPIGQNDLVTDGSYLYWADGSAIRKMPIAGGAIKVLASGANFSHVGLDATNVFYSAGSQIWSVPKSGGTATELVSAPGTSISAMSVDDQYGYDELIYGETNGSVTERVYLSPTDVELDVIEPPRAGITITSVTLQEGTSPHWGECSGSFCDIDGTTPTSGVPVDVQGDGNDFYWGAADLYSLSAVIIE